MTQVRTDAAIRISANAPVFDLPILVALREGLFDKAGLDVRYLRGVTAPNGAHYALDGANIYNLCAWSGAGEIDVDLAGGKARIAALRPAIVAQAIVSFDETLFNPHDLAEVAIGVNLHHASHFATRQLISGSIPPDCLRIAPAGGPEDRLQRLISGELRAVTLMEPHLSIALQAGAHMVAMTFYRGADVLGSDITDDQADVYYDVINEAVDAIRADFARFRHLVTAPVGDRLAPEALGTQFVRYTHAETYDPVRSVRIAPWARAWAEGASGIH